MCDVSSSEAVQKIAINDFSFRLLYLLPCYRHCSYEKFILLKVKKKKICVPSFCVNMLRRGHLQLVDKFSLYMYTFMFFFLIIEGAAYIQVRLIVWKLL